MTWQITRRGSDVFTEAIEEALASGDRAARDVLYDLPSVREEPIRGVSLAMPPAEPVRDVRVLAAGRLGPRRLTEVRADVTRPEDSRELRRRALSHSFSGDVRVDLVVDTCLDDGISVGRLSVRETPADEIGRLDRSLLAIDEVLGGRAEQPG